MVSAESRLTSAAGLTRLCCRASPAGLCALSINNDNCYLAYPGSATIGEVQVFDTINLVSASPGRPSLPLLRNEPRGASGLRGSCSAPRFPPPPAQAEQVWGMRRPRAECPPSSERAGSSGEDCLEKLLCLLVKRF